MNSDQDSDDGLLDVGTPPTRTAMNKQGSGKAALAASADVHADATTYAPHLAMLCRL